MYYLKPNLYCDKSVVLKMEMFSCKRLLLKAKKKTACWKESPNNWMKMYKFSVTLWNSIKMYGDK